MTVDDGGEAQSLLARVLTIGALNRHDVDGLAVDGVDANPGTITEVHSDEFVPGEGVGVDEVFYEDAILTGHEPDLELDPKDPQQDQNKDDGSRVVPCRELVHAEAW